MIQTKWIALKIPRLRAEKCVSVRGKQHVTLSETELFDPSFSFTEPAAYTLKNQKKGIDSHLQ